MTCSVSYQVSSCMCTHKEWGNKGSVETFVKKKKPTILDASTDLKGDIGEVGVRKCNNHQGFNWKIREKRRLKKKQKHL